MNINLVWQHSTAFFITTIPAMLNVGLVLYIWLRMPRTQLTYIFILFLLSLTSWQVMDAFLRLAADRQTAMSLDIIFSHGWMLPAPLSLHFALLYSRRSGYRLSRMRLLALYLPALVFMALYSPFSNAQDYHLLPFWGWCPVRHTPFQSALLTWYISVIGLTVYILLRNTFRTRHEARAHIQALMIFAGFSVPALQGIITQGIFSLVLKTDPIPLASTSMGAIGIVTIIALRRFGLFHIHDSVDTIELMNALADIVLVVSPHKHNIKYINPAGLRELGYTAAEIGQLRIGSLLEPKEQEGHLLEAITNSLRDKNKQTAYASLRRRDDTIIPVTITVTPIISGHATEGAMLIAHNMAELMQAYDVIAYKDTWYRTLIEDSDDTIVLLDTDGKVQYASPSVRHLLGYVPEELTGRELSSLLNDADKAAYDLFMKEAGKQNGAAGSIRMRMHHKLGAVPWVEGKCLNMLHHPVIGAMVMHLGDISVQQQVETEKEETLVLFSSLLESLQSGLMLVDSNSRIISVNEEFCRMFHMQETPEQLAGLPCHPMLDVHKQMVTDPQGFEQCVMDTLAAREPVTGQEVKFLTGEIYERDYVPIHKSNGDFVGHLWYYRDATERTRHIEEINRQSAFLNQFFDASPLAMTLLDTKSHVMAVNPAFTRLYQHELHEIKGKSLLDCIVPPASLKRALAIWRSSLRGKIVNSEAQRMRKDKELVDVSITSYPIMVDGQIQAVYTIYMDITERKKAQEQLIDKNRELEKINNELDKLVYSVSHDIRSPLMSILGIINMAEMEIRDEDSLEYIRLIRRNVNRLDDFTNEVIQYSRNSRGQLHVEEIDIHELIDESIESLRYQASHVQFSVDAGEDSYPFHSDAGRLRIVLNNIISNAIKYRQDAHGKPYVRISLRSSPQAVKLEIEDNGEGIPEEKLGEIYNMFTRFTLRSNGSGLGLYIVKEAVEKLQGSISVYSEVGRGTKFTVELPNLVAETV